MSLVLVALAGCDDAAKDADAEPSSAGRPPRTRSSAEELELARAARARGELRASVEAYERALAAGAAGDELRIELLEVTVESGEFERAREQLEHLESARATDTRAAPTEPGERRREAKLEYLAARVRLALGASEEAEIAARRSVELHPTNALSRRLLGRILAERGDDEAAIVELREALRGLLVIGARLESASVHYQLARSLTRLGREDEAAVHFAEHEKLQEMRARLGRLERRASYAPDSREAWVELGLAQLRAGLGDAGFRSLARAEALGAERDEGDELAARLERVSRARTRGDERDLLAALAALDALVRGAAVEPDSEGDGE